MRHKCKCNLVEVEGAGDLQGPRGGEGAPGGGVVGAPGHRKRKRRQPW